MSLFPSRNAIWLVAVLGLASGCAVGERVALEHDGASRNYYLVVPDDLPAGAPIVVSLHGGGPSGTDKGRRVGAFTGLADLAAEQGFVGVFPSSLQGNWNDGRDLVKGHVSEDVDDAGFLLAVVDDVVARTGADPDRVVMSGTSNGGFMTQRMLCEHPGRFVAGVSVIATYPATLECTPGAPVAVQWIVGTGDLLVPYEGGPVAGGDRGEALSADEAFATRAAVNGCSAEVVTEDLPDTDPDDGTTARREEATGCVAPVSRVVIEGGGHAWPGGSQYLPVKTIGPVSRDVKGEDLLWDFVSPLLEADPR